MILLGVDAGVRRRKMTGKLALPLSWRLDVQPEDLGKGKGDINEGRVVTKRMQVSQRK